MTYTPVVNLCLQRSFNYGLCSLGVIIFSDGQEGDINALSESSSDENKGGEE